MMNVLPPASIDLICAAQALLQALGPIFQRHANGATLAVDYRSVAIVGRPA